MTPDDVANELYRIADNIIKGCSAKQAADDIESVWDGVGQAADADHWPED